VSLRHLVVCASVCECVLQCDDVRWAVCEGVFMVAGSCACTCMFVCVFRACACTCVCSCVYVCVHVCVYV